MQTVVGNTSKIGIPLQWRHNEHGDVSNHCQLECLLNRLFRCISKKTSKLRVTGLCERSSPVTDEFPLQMASTAENVSIWWGHHVFIATEKKLMLRTYLNVTGLPSLPGITVDCTSGMHWYPHFCHNLVRLMEYVSALSFVMMTASNRNIFRVTGPLWGESTGYRWISLIRPETRSFVFFDLHLNKRLSKKSTRRWFETPSPSL